MSPTPATFASPTAPAGYAWEATDEEIAARYHVPIERIARFDLNTSPSPPKLAARALASGRLVRPLSEYPPSDYHRLVEAAAGRYGVDPVELLVGAGADEILDIIAKAFLPPGGSAVVPTPTYAMFPVLTEQRPGTVVRVPRLAAAGTFAIDGPAMRDAAASAHLVWLCSPNNPTALAEPPGVIRDLLAGIRTDAEAAGRPLPVVVLDEAYAEFTRSSLVGLRDEYPALVVVRTVSKAYALAGLRVGFAIARPELIASMAPYRPPGSVSVVSVSIATEILTDAKALESNLRRVEAERERFATALRDAGWNVLPSVTNFLLVDLGTPVKAGRTAEGLLRRGLVPRTFSSDHPLATCLRLSVRNAAQDDRLIEAARDLT